MSAKRKARLPVRPKSNGDNGKYLDYVSRAGVKGVAVGQHDNDDPLLTVIQAQLGGGRVPRDFYNPPNVINVWEVNPDIKPLPVGKKWCTHCAEWVKFENFSPNKGNRDGLQSWCKFCRAEHARYMYWQQKNTAALPKAA